LAAVEGVCNADDIQIVFRQLATNKIQLVVSLTFEGRKVLLREKERRGRA
jgi:hypothetical protein